VSSGFKASDKILGGGEGGAEEEDKHPFARDGLRAGCRCGPKGRQPTRGQGASAVVRTQAARAKKYIEFHGGVRLPHVYLPARSLRCLRRALRAAGCREAGVSHGARHPGPSKRRQQRC
jgi:hypothetical protein